MINQVVQIKDVGFQFGIRKPFPVSTEKVWNFSEKRLREKSTIAIHQEKLLNSEQKNEMKENLTKIIE